MAAATSYRSSSPSPNSPSLVPSGDVVPRVLNRSTASPASAGSRNAALRSRWLSIIPPWVGSGCRQINVATGSESAGSASSPTRRGPSEVRRVTGVRLAGSTVAGLISLTGGLASWCPPCPARSAVHPVLPAGPVPVPALVQADVDPVGGPGHQVRRAGRDLLVAPGTTVRFRGPRARHLPDHPVPVGPRFDTLGPGARRRRT